VETICLKLLINKKAYCLCYDAFPMVKLEQNFNGRTFSDVRSDVSSDVDVTLSDVVTDDTITVQLPQGLPLDNLHTEYKKTRDEALT
jgi:hypothetical protein